MSAGAFKSKALQQKIVQDGFAIVPFATADELNELRGFYNSAAAVEMQGTHVTMFQPSTIHREQVDKRIKDVFAERAQNYMNRYTVLYTNFIIKEPGIGGDFPLHQDWTYVDETKFSSYAFWIPMQDVDQTNGALHVVKGSHKFITALRGPYIHEPFSQISNQIKEKYALPINMKAGEALIWDHRLIHFSKPNLSLAARMAFTLIMVPTEATTIHCIGKPETHGTIIEKYAADKSFYMNYTIGARPDFASLIETVEQKAISITENELKEMFTT